MSFPISDDLRLDVDTLNWTLRQRAGTDKEGKEVWKPIAYYTSLAGALQGISNRQLKSCSDFEDVLDAINKLYTDIERWFPEGEDLMKRLRQMDSEKIPQPKDDEEEGEPDWI